MIANDEASAVFKRVANSTANMVSSINKSVISFGDGLRHYNNAMYDFNRVAMRTLETAGVATYKFTSDSIKNFTEFELQHAKTMGAMASNYDKTAESQRKFFGDQKKLSQEAIKLGTVGPKGTGSLYTPQDVAFAQTSLIKAGVNPGEISGSGAIPSIIKFAGGNDMSLDDSTTFAVNLGTQFDIPMDKWEGMLDMITRAADLSVIDVPDIMESMKYAGGIASSLNRPLSEILGAVGVMGNAGLKGSMAGTGIQSFMTRLLSTPNALTDAVAGQAPGIADSVYESFKSEVVDENGNMRDMQDISYKLDQAMGLLNDEESAWFAKKLFGLFQMKAAYALSKQGKDGTNLLADMINEINTTSDGTNDKKYDLLIESSYGRQSKVKNAWTGVQTDFGERLKPMTDAIADELYRFLSDSGNFEDIDFSRLKVAIHESGNLLSKKYGEELARVVETLGGFGIDASRVGAAVVPTVGGIVGTAGEILTGEFWSKLLSDPSSAFETLTSSVENTYDKINDLPPELQELAKQANNAMLALSAIAAINFAAKITESIGTIWKYTGGKLISTLTNIASSTTNVTSTQAIMNTTTMNVTAGVVNVSSGGAGTSTPTGTPSGSATSAPGTPTSTPTSTAPVGKDVGGAFLAGAARFAGVFGTAVLLSTIPSSKSQDNEAKKAGLSNANVDNFIDRKTGVRIGDLPKDNGVERPWWDIFGIIGKGSSYDQAVGRVDVSSQVPDDYKKKLDKYLNNIDGMKNWDVGKNYISGLAESHYFNNKMNGNDVTQSDYVAFADRMIGYMTRELQSNNINGLPNSVYDIPNMNNDASSYMKSTFGKIEPRLNIPVFDEYNKLVNDPMNMFNVYKEHKEKAMDTYIMDMNGLLTKQGASIDDIASIMESANFSPTVNVKPPNVDVYVTVDQSGKLISKKSIIPEYNDFDDWYKSQSSRFGK